MSSLIEIEVEIRHQTEKSILVALDEDSEGVWIPLSQCEIYGSMITLPKWLAIKKRLV